MDHKQLVDKLARSLKRDRNDIKNLIEAFNAVVASRCGELDSIAVPGFGTLEGRKKNERVMVNPATHKRMLIPPKISLNFKVSNVLKNRMKP